MDNILSQKQIRIDNAKKILQLMLGGNLHTRKDISEQCEMSLSTVTQIVSPFLKQGLVEEIKQGSSTGGRKPTYIQFNPNYGRIAIFDVSDVGTSLYIFALSGVLVKQEVLFTGTIVIQELFEKVIMSIKKENDSNSPILSVGLVIQEGLYSSTSIVMAQIGYELLPLSLESAISTVLKVKTNQTTSKSFNLDYYIGKEEKRKYCSISITDKITFSIVIDGKKVSIGRKDIFDGTELFDQDAIIPLIENQSINILANIIQTISVLFSIQEFVIAESSKVSEQQIIMLKNLLSSQISLEYLKVESDSYSPLVLYVEELVEKLIPTIIEQIQL